MNDFCYPIGKFAEEPNASAKQKELWLQAIEQAPSQFREAVSGLNDEQLDTPYRDGGWTVRQVVHHVADSHMHSYLRFRFALTEPSPAIKPYDEAVWAGLPDAKGAPVELSLALLEPLHARWAILLRSLSDADWGKAYVHPELGPVSLSKALQLYAWHGRHHLAHINELRKRSGW